MNARIERRVGTRAGLAAKIVIPAALAALLVLALPPAAAAAGGSFGWGQDDGFCSLTSKDMKSSCDFAAKQDFWLAAANCDNLPTADERRACIDEAEESWYEDTALCDEQYDARQEVCEALGEDPYHPVIEPADFVEEIDNPYLPLQPGATWCYEKDTEEGLEEVQVTVTDETREILGIETTVVQDTEWFTEWGEDERELVEDTQDYFAQDAWGNVWYFGEISREFEDGYLAGLEGSWIAGEDGAKPGIIMQAQPAVGQVYRQEFFLGEAEDMGAVESLNASDPYGTFTGALMTRDWTPVEPDEIEYKFYVLGVGLVLEAEGEPDSEDRVELVPCE